MPIYSVGVRERVLYFVMPLVQGETLRAHLERLGRVDPPVAVRILSEVARALTAAHGAGLVHRDLKPENLMLEGSQQQTVILDFGVAKALGETSGSATRDGVAIGTPWYMAPEQAFGHPAVDHRADIYALGVIGYEMVMGTRPFEGESFAELAESRRSIDAATLQEQRPGLPDGLCRVIAKCLALDPAERWTDAADVARVLTRPPSSGDDVRAPTPSVSPQAAPAGSNRIVTDLDLKSVRQFDPGVARLFDVVSAAKPSLRHPNAARTIGLLVVAAAIGVGGWSFFLSSSRAPSDGGLVNLPLPAMPESLLVAPAAPAPSPAAPVSSPPAPPTTRPTQCTAWNDTTYNVDGSCYTAPPRLVSEPLVPLDQSVPTPPTRPAALVVQILPDGSVGTILVRDLTDQPPFSVLAVNYAKQATYEAATKEGQPVMAFGEFRFYAR